MRRRPMKRQLSPLDYSEFYRAVAERQTYRCWGCVLAPHERWKCLHRSDGRIDAHHLVAQQTLRRELDEQSLHAALRDGRNGVLVGRYHHGTLESRYMRAHWEDLPACTLEFAAAYGLLWVLERNYPRRVRLTA